MKETGTVYLVGAGPGDPALQTLRCKELISRADCIVYDSLANNAILNACRPSAKLIYVGKRVGQHSHSQEAINQILIDEAQKHELIVRLKGGDPFVFGRGGEEMQALSKADVPYEVVPGVTAGTAVPAYAGIPVTHRGVARAVSFITGFTKEHSTTELDWESLIRLDNTLVFYMSSRLAPQISSKLMAAGMPAYKPMCIISNGTLPNQRVIRGKIADFTPDFCNYEELSPALIVIGDTVAFADNYAWRKKLPLAGRNIVVTRSLHQQSALADKLQALGANIISLPSIELHPCKDQSPLQDAIKSIGVEGRYSWLVFTSVNAVEIFFDELYKSGFDARRLAQLRIGAVGRITAEALKKRGIQADFVPQNHTGEDFARELIERYGTVEGEQILIPGSELSRTHLADILQANGAHCKALTIYQNRPADYSEERLQELSKSPIDLVTFCSSSAVDNFFALVEKYQLGYLLEHTQMASIGRLTSKSIVKQHLSVHIEAPEASIDSLIEAIVKAFEKPSASKTN